MDPRLRSRGQSRRRRWVAALPVATAVAQALALAVAMEVRPPSLQLLGPAVS